MRYFAAVMLLAAGCTVEMGAGKIAPLAVDQPVSLIKVAASGRPAFSLKVETEFLSADQSASLADTYGGKINAITAIDLDVEELDIRDVSDTAVVDGLTLRLVIDGVTIDETAVGSRVHLPPSVCEALKHAINTRVALEWGVTATLRTSTPSMPPQVVAHALMQPIAIVDALKAL